LLTDIIKELNEFGIVELDHDQTIVCVVGDFSADKKGYALPVLEAVKEIPVRMISYGGSNFNISLLLKTADKELALRSLHAKLF
jgi:aspartate kinase